MSSNKPLCILQEFGSHFLLYRLVSSVRLFSCSIHEIIEAVRDQLLEFIISQTHYLDYLSGLLQGLVSLCGWFISLHTPIVEEFWRWYTFWKGRYKVVSVWQQYCSRLAMVGSKGFHWPIQTGATRAQIGVMIHSPNSVDLKVYICITQLSVVMLTELMDML